MKSHISYECNDLYSMNKTLIANNESPLTEKEIQDKEETVANYIRKKHSQYYMLLCHEQRDYTIFRVDSVLNDKPMKAAKILLEECMKNRGQLFSVEEDNVSSAIELWVKGTTEELNAYYFFPYDSAMIEV